MSANCDKCDSSGIELGARALSGNGFNQGGLTDQIRQNIAFRVQSMTSVLMGATSTDGMSPVERRQRLQENRRQLMGQLPGPMGGGSGSGTGNGSMGGTTTDRRGEGSGQIGRTGTSPSQTDTGSVSDSTPSMSDVSRGTKERADDRGFGY